MQVIVQHCMRRYPTLLTTLDSSVFVLNLSVNLSKGVTYIAVRFQILHILYIASLCPGSFDTATP